MSQSEAFRPNFENKLSWKQWLKVFDNYLFATNKNHMNDKAKIATLLHCIRPEAQRTYNNFAVEVTNYDEALQILNSLFGNRSSLTFLRYSFRNLKQKSFESFQNFYSELKEMVVECDYGIFEQDAIYDQIVSGVYDFKLREKFLSTDRLTL